MNPGTRKNQRTDCMHSRRADVSVQSPCFKHKCDSKGLARFASKRCEPGTLANAIVRQERQCRRCLITSRQVGSPSAFIQGLSIAMAVSLLPFASMRSPPASTTLSPTIQASLRSPVHNGYWPITIKSRESGRRNETVTPAPQLDPPSITINPPLKASAELFANSRGVQVTISHSDQEVETYYTLTGEKLTCDPPSGTAYTTPLLLCSSELPYDISALACKAGSGAAESKPASVLGLNVQAHQTARPAAPQFDTMPADACRESESGGLSCNSGGLFRVLLDSDELACSNPDWETQADCLREGFVWDRVLWCSGLGGQNLPCITIYYTVDGSDPSEAASNRFIYQSQTGIPVGAGVHRIKAVVVRSRRRFDAQSCHCCCKAGCEVVGAEAEQGLEVRNAQPTGGNARDARIGSPDITLTLQTPFETFQDLYYSKPYQWRTEVAQALGLFEKRKPDYRRIKGECTCSLGFGCVRAAPEANTPTGPEICFHPASTEGTQVSIFITAAGVCVGGGKSDDVCISNSSCGDGTCDVEDSSWRPAYARLQIKHKETWTSLTAMGVVDAALQLDIDAAAALGSNADTAELVGGVVAIASLVLVLLASRKCIAEKLCRLLPSLKTKGRQIKAKVRQVRDEGRLTRHAQFAKMTELSEDNDSRASADLSLADESTHLDTGSGQLTSLWATKGSYDKPRIATVNPITAFFSATTTTMPQTMGMGSRSSDDLLRTQIMEEGGGPEREAEWSSFTDTAEQQVRLLRELVGSTQELSVEIEYEPSAIASRRPTLVQNLIFRNTSSTEVSSFTCKAAVPKYMQVQITPPSESTMPPNSRKDVTQTLRLSGVDPLKPIKVRLKLEYTSASRGIADETLDVNIGDLPQT